MITPLSSGILEGKKWTVSTDEGVDRPPDASVLMEGGGLGIEHHFAVAYYNIQFICFQSIILL